MPNIGRWHRTADISVLFGPFRVEQGLGTQRECSRVRDSACSVLDGFYCQASNQESGCSLAEMHTRCTAGQTAAEPGRRKRSCSHIYIYEFLLWFSMLGFQNSQRVLVGTRTTDTVCEDCETGFYSPDGTNCTACNMWVMPLAPFVSFYFMNSSKYFICLTIFTITYTRWLRPVKETTLS